MHCYFWQGEVILTYFSFFNHIFVFEFKLVIYFKLFMCTN